MKIFLLFLFSVILTLTSYCQFPRNQKIVAAEYFINSDPGPGNGIPINIGGTPQWEVNVNLSNIQLPIGSKIYIRFKSTNGRWSAPRGIERKPYFETSGGILQYGELFINNDPGQGSGQQIDILDGTVDISGLNLKRGDRVYFRIKDNFNRWSPARPVIFNFKEIDRAEFYILHASGSTSNVQPMSLSPYNPYSCVYTAYAYDIPKNKLDTVFIRFQTVDKFYSKWEKTRLDNVGIDDLSINNFKLISYPNPFSNFTTIFFTNPEPAYIKLRIIGLLGMYFNELISETMPAGKHEIVFDSTLLPEGIYLCQLYVNDQVSSIKLIVLKE